MTIMSNYSRVPGIPVELAGERFTRVRISVVITCNSRGMNRKEIERLCFRLERTAKGRSSSRKVSAIC
jgi:hypothetical protein